MNYRLLISLCALFIGGCASTLLQDRIHTFYVPGGVIQVEQTGCGLNRAFYKDTSGNGNNRPSVQFVAVSSSGDTIESFNVYCKPAIANGRSICDVIPNMVGWQNAGGFGCPNLKDLRQLR